MLPSSPIDLKIQSLKIYFGITLNGSYKYWHLNTAKPSEIIFRPGPFLIERVLGLEIQFFVKVDFFKIMRERGYLRII